MARQLLGKILELDRQGETLSATIVETEAYLAFGDAASHSHRGPTPRSRIMFGPPGVAYVYLIYGMYHCLNAVTEPAGSGAAVLIRALDPAVPGRHLVSKWTRKSLAGPGRLCREFGIDLRMNGWDLSASPLRILGGPEVSDDEVVVGPRVGINRAATLDLRYRLGAKLPSAAGA